MKLSPRARRYAKGFGIAAGFLAFIPYGSRAVFLATSYFTEHLGESEIGATVGFVAISLFAALENAAVGAAIGAVVGVAVALVVDRFDGKGLTQPRQLASYFSPRTKRWGAWSALLFGGLAVILSAYVLIWPNSVFQDPEVLALPPLRRALDHIGQILEAVVFQGVLGWILGAGAGAIANQLSKKSQPSNARS
jgi:hypothetical protein